MPHGAVASGSAPADGSFSADGFHLGYTLASGQVFRWGRDRDGWWKGIAYGTAFHLRQDGNKLVFRASARQVTARGIHLSVAEFLRWYLRVDEAPGLRVPRWDGHLRRARDRLRGLRFVRQEPFECIVSYVLSPQAHMSLTKRRIGLLARNLGKEIYIGDERYWAFPGPRSLARLGAADLRRHRFGYRSERLPLLARRVVSALDRATSSGEGHGSQKLWEEVVEDLREVPGTGVGLKVAKCIQLFALERPDAVPVDTWVRKLAEAWYGVKGSDAKICAWGEARGGKWPGYANEYLFAYYRELHARSIFDRVISFCESCLPSAVLPFERRSRSTLGPLNPGPPEAVVDHAASGRDNRLVGN